MLAQRLSGWTRRDHADAAERHKVLWNTVSVEWHRIADEAARAAWGRPFRPEDRVSVIGSLDFPLTTREQLRELSITAAAHAAASSLHAHAAHATR